MAEEEFRIIFNGRDIRDLELQSNEMGRKIEADIDAGMGFQSRFIELSESEQDEIF